LDRQENRPKGKKTTSKRDLTAKASKEGEAFSTEGGQKKGGEGGGAELSRERGPKADTNSGNYAVWGE